MQTPGVSLAEPDPDDHAAWVARLADPHRASPAFWHLVRSGDDAREAVVRGLRSDDVATRRACARVLDHLVDDSAFPALIELLDDSDARVRVEATHALSCDRCKDNDWRPTPHAVLPKAIDVLAHDEDAHVRAYAVELVGRYVHTYPAAEQAVIAAAEHDASPAVRKKARWYAPGGPIHTRTRPT
jgi:hypothetical protein